MRPDCDLTFALASLRVKAKKIETVMSLSFVVQGLNVLLNVDCFTSCIAGRMAGVGLNSLEILALQIRFSVSSTLHS